MISGVFESSDVEYNQIQFVYDKIKCELPEKYNSVEKFCGCLVYGGLTSFCKELEKMGVL